MIIKSVIVNGDAVVDCRPGQYAMWYHGKNKHRKMLINAQVSHASFRLVMCVVVTLGSRVCVCVSSSCYLHSPHRLLTMLTMPKTPTCQRMVTGRESSASLVSSSVVRRQGSRDMNRFHPQTRMNLASLQFVVLSWVSSRPRTKSS